MGFGGGIGGFSIGPSSVQSNAEAGLPFAELPDDFLKRIDKVLEKEPEHPDPKISFSHNFTNLPPPEHRSPVADKLVFDTAVVRKAESCRDGAQEVRAELIAFRVT